MTPPSRTAGETDDPRVTRLVARGTDRVPGRADAPDGPTGSTGSSGSTGDGVPGGSTGGPGSRLVIARVRGAVSASGAPVVVEVAGPEFVAAPVLAVDGATLVAIGRRSSADHVAHLEVWRGQPDAPVLVADLGAGVAATALVHHDGTWHLFGRDDEGRAIHHTSDDLVRWAVDARFADDHSQLCVRGATAGAAGAGDRGVVLLGEVVVGDRRIGWTLLDLVDGRCRAREVTFPLTVDHDVVGPVHLGGDRIALVVASGSSRLVARSIEGSGARSWAVALLHHDLVPTAAAADGDRVWVIGTDPATGGAIVADASGGSFRLDRVVGGPGAAVMLRDLLVMATWIDPADGRPSTGSAAEAQSSPAYIDSISAA